MVPKVTTTFSLIIKICSKMMCVFVLIKDTIRYEEHGKDENDREVKYDKELGSTKSVIKVIKMNTMKTK